MLVVPARRIWLPWHERMTVFGLAFQRLESGLFAPQRLWYIRPIFRPTPEWCNFVYYGWFPRSFIGDTCCD